MFGAAEIRAQTDRDALGRISQYREYMEGSNGQWTSQNRYGIGYDLSDRVTSEYLSQLKTGTGGGTFLSLTTNTYAAAGGALDFSSVKNWLNGNDANAADTSMDYVLEWADGSRVVSSVYDSDTASGSNPIHTSTYSYDGLGRLAKVSILDGRQRTVSFASTLESQGRFSSQQISLGAPLGA